MESGLHQSAKVVLFLLLISIAHYVQTHRQQVPAAMMCVGTQPPSNNLRAIVSSRGKSWLHSWHETVSGDGAAICKPEEWAITLHHVVQNGCYQADIAVSSSKKTDTPFRKGSVLDIFRCTWSNRGFLYVHPDVTIRKVHCLIETWVRGWHHLPQCAGSQRNTSWLLPRA